MTTGRVREWQSTPASGILETLPCGRLQRRASLLGRAPGVVVALVGTLNAGVYRSEVGSALQAKCSLSVDSIVMTTILPLQNSSLEVQRQTIQPNLRGLICL